MGDILFMLGLAAALELRDQSSPSAAPAQHCLSERAEEEREWARPAPGIPLLAGIETGMSRDAVRRISPRLLGTDPGGSFELVPGLRLPAQVVISHKSKAVVSVSLRSNGRMDRILAALKQRHGEPAMLDQGVHFITNPIGITGGVATERFEKYRWCDGPRAIILKGGDYDVWIEITAARP